MRRVSASTMAPGLWSVYVAQYLRSLGNGLDVMQPRVGEIGVRGAWWAVPQSAGLMCKFVGGTSPTPCLARYSTTGVGRSVIVWPIVFDFFLQSMWTYLVARCQPLCWVW